MLRYASRALVLPLVLLMSTAAGAQDAAAPDAAAAEPAAAEPAATDAAAAPQTPFDLALAQFRDILAKIKELQLNFKLVKPAERPAIEEQYAALVKEGDVIFTKMLAEAEAEYTAGERAKDDIDNLLVVKARDDFKADNYDSAYRLSKLLSDNDFKYKQTLLWAGMSAWAMGDYDNAGKYLKLAQENNMLDDQGEAVLAQLDKHREAWQKEQAIREQEAATDDLPRVLLKTNQGDIVVELFENEAPNTVANFINLVERKFYDGLSFHRVIHSFMAQGGDPKGDGTGGPGYTIPCECYEDDHRLHFRGTLSMAHSGRDTGGSQFFLTFRPTTHLDGRHTAFGRVVEGSDPDKIISATVVRKRNHDYTPTKKADG
jgi:cyclophilin family peptidyl-prolyl cis-trans isomerase